MKAAIFTLLALVGVAYGTKCFECNSAQDSSCGDPFSADSPAMQEAFLKDCPEKEDGVTFCRKNKMWLTGEERVQRDCAYLRRENYTCYQTRADDHIVDVCQCDGDSCNTATDVSGSILTAVAVVVAALGVARY